MTEAYEGITVEVFERAARRFFEIARHPVRGVPYTRLAYHPMRELIDLLRAAEFEVYICPAGGRDFVRVVAQENRSPDNVLGRLCWPGDAKTFETVLWLSYDARNADPAAFFRRKCPLPAPGRRPSHCA